MNDMPYVYLYFADGTTLFVAIALIVLGVVSLVVSGRLASVILIVGTALLLASWPPISSGLQVMVLLIVWGGAIAAARNELPLPYRLVAGGGVVVTALFLIAPHYPERFPQCLPQHLVVVGDSLSSRPEPAWPERLARQTTLNVTNRSQSGLRTGGAIEYASRPAERPCTLLLFVGGNDLLAGTSLSAFRSNWRTLLRKARQTCDRVLSVALPTLPGKTGYARIQHSLNEQNHIDTIPASVFLSVYARPGTRTMDGLHFTNRGQTLLARNVARGLGIK